MTLIGCGGTCRLANILRNRSVDPGPCTVVVEVEVMIAFCLARKVRVGRAIDCSLVDFRLTVWDDR